MADQKDITEHLGQQRHELHKDHPTHRPLSKGYDGVGIAGEIALSKFSGMAVDLSLRPGGDDGIDNHIYLRHSVNVHAARIPKNLIHEVGKKMAEIMILGDYDEATGVSELLGWEWGRVLVRAPSRDFEHGVINHYIERGKLRDMKELEERMLKL